MFDIAPSAQPRIPALMRSARRMLTVANVVSSMRTICRLEGATGRSITGGVLGVLGRCVVSNLFQLCMQFGILIRMQSTSVRIDQVTHQELKRLADRLGTTVGETVALAVRRLRQDRIGEELTATLSRDETDWLDADLG